MRFLSLSRPWPWAIFDPVADKGIENRTWAPPVELIGHQIALQASKTWDDGALRLFLELGLTDFPNRKEMYPHSVIVGVATIDRVVTTSRTLSPSQARWFFGETTSDGKTNYGWILSDRIALPTPVHCPGGLGLRTLPESIAAEVLSQVALARAFQRKD